MDVNNRGGLSYLDKIRLNQSRGGFRETFHELGETQRTKAVACINDEKLYFPSLFLLIPEVDQLNLYEELNSRNALALHTCAKILKYPEMTARMEERSSVGTGTDYPVLKWMMRTGAPEDGLSNQYDQVLDGTASLLTGKYRDETTLPVMADLLFQRHKKGALIHDLAWSFFQTRNPQALRLIADYLRSDDPQDVQLACKLLHFTPSMRSDGEDAPQIRHKAYLRWLRENAPFLYFTGESFQLTSEPEPYRVNLDAKYLGRRVSAASGKPLKPLTRFEQSCLQQFHLADEEEKELLAQYSHQLRKRDVLLWNNWMRYDLDTQIRTAEQERRGV